MLFITAGCSYNPLFFPWDTGYDVRIRETRRSIVIHPSEGPVSSTGLLFYPGGLVDSHVYNEILARFAVQAGVTVLVAKMPGNLAVLDSHAGLALTKTIPEISQWVIAGHSLGGAMAAATVKDHPGAYEGLIFMDSYPPDGASLKEWSGALLSLFSSVEKTQDPERMTQTLALIPPAVWLENLGEPYPTPLENYSVLHTIPGGSHSYFGTYGPQDGDYPPVVTREAFHGETVDFMTEFFTRNGWR